MKTSISAYFLVLVLDEIMRACFYLGLLSFQIQSFKNNRNPEAAFGSHRKLLSRWIIINVVVGIVTNVIVIYYQKRGAVKKK